MVWWPCDHNSFLNSYQGDFDEFLQYFAENKPGARLVLYQACTDGYLDIVQWLVEERKVNIHDNNDVALRWACGNGHIQIAKWLVDDIGMNIHAEDEFIFIDACKNGDIEIAKWLVDVYNVDIHANNEDAFYNAFVYDRTNIIKWFEQELSDTVRYFYHNHIAYIIGCNVLKNWSHCFIRECPVAYIACWTIPEEFENKIDEAAVIARIENIHISKSAHSAKI